MTHPITHPSLYHHRKNCLTVFTPCTNTPSLTNTPSHTNYINHINLPPTPITLSPQEELPDSVDPLYVDALMASHSDLFILNPKSTFSWMIYVVRVALALQVTPLYSLWYIPS